MLRGTGTTFKRQGRSDVLSVCIAVLAVMMVFGLCSFSEAANATTSGAISARAVDETSIVLSMPYTGDDNQSNTYTVQYKPCTEGTYTAWITNAPHTNSPYTTTITGLAKNTCYDIKTTYNDLDNVGGAVTQTIRITSTWDNTLLHNVNRFPSSGKWTTEGGWGLPGTKYGKINCETCHTPRASNIKGISGNITAPNGTEQFPGETGGLGINFKSQTTPDGFGDDTNGHSASKKICEYCHSQTTYHRYNTTGQSYLTHNNNADCLVCHPHAEGFYYAAGACDSCHGNPPTADTFGGPSGLASSPKTGSTTAGSHSFHATSEGRNFACAVCHSNSVGTGATHRDGTISLGFVNLLGTGNSAGSYDGQTGANYESTDSGTSVTNGGTKTCSNIYCHGVSMAPNGGTNTSPKWDDPLTAACGTCHGATAANPPTRGSHTKHAGSGSGGRALECTACHLGYPTNHIDGSVNWSLDTSTYSWLSGAQYRGAVSGSATPVPSTTYGSCSNVYCHSNVQTSPPGGALTYAAPQWGNALSGQCGTCHKGDGVNGNATLMDSGSHAKHTSTYSLVCSSCHNNAGYGTSKHADHNVDVAFSAGGSYSGSGTPGETYGTCSNVYCHSNSLGAYQNPTWGNTSTGQCGTCHGVLAATPPASAAHTKHVGAAANYRFSCSKCHDSVVNSTADSTTQPTIKNTSLHVDTNKEVQFDSYNSGGLYTGGTCSNIYCHSDGTTVSSGGTPSSSVIWSSSVTCGSCHQYPPSYANGSPKANSHPAHTSAGITCDKCHNGTTTDGSSITNAANHANKTYNVVAGSGASFTYLFSPSGGTCSTVSCHGNTDAQWGVANCLACHAQSWATERRLPLSSAPTRITCRADPYPAPTVTVVTGRRIITAL